MIDIFLFECTGISDSIDYLFIFILKFLYFLFEILELLSEIYFLITNWFNDLFVAHIKYTANYKNLIVTHHYILLEIIQSSMSN